MIPPDTRPPVDAGWPEFGDGVVPTFRSRRAASALAPAAPGAKGFGWRDRLVWMALGIIAIRLVDLAGFLWWWLS